MHDQQSKLLHQKQQAASNHMQALLRPHCMQNVMKKQQKVSRCAHVA
jgi:hypothetical protein